MAAALALLTEAWTSVAAALALLAEAGTSVAAALALMVVALESGTSVAAALALVAEAGTSVAVPLALLVVALDEVSPESGSVGPSTTSPGTSGASMGYRCIYSKNFPLNSSKNELLTEVGAVKLMLVALESGTSVAAA